MLADSYLRSRPQDRSTINKTPRGMPTTKLRIIKINAAVIIGRGLWSSLRVPTAYVNKTASLTVAQ